MHQRTYSLSFAGYLFFHAYYDRFFYSILVYSFRKESFFSLLHLQPSAVYPFLAVTVILYVKAFFFDSERRKCELYINNLFLILISMCLLMTSMPLMQTRYFIIRFFFMPLVVPYFFTAKGSLCDYYLITVPLCFAFRFFSTPSIWLASSNDIVYRSIFDYL